MEQLDMRFPRVLYIYLETVTYYMPEKCPRQLGLDEAQVPEFAPMRLIRLIDLSVNKK